ncbi:MAG: hypothetical protein DCC44_02770 [Acidobacteria bacterium]|nr:MAG: hypothetical protein DCC44_02770 [Acidobacteriota bacterium]
MQPKNTDADISLCELCGLSIAALRLLPIELHVISLCTLHVDPNAKNAKVIAKISKTLPRNPSPSRPLRASLRELLRFLLFAFTLFLFALFTLIQTQRTQRHFVKIAKTLPRDSTLRVLCGLRSATFAFPAEPSPSGKLRFSDTLTKAPRRRSRHARTSTHVPRRKRRG